MGEVSRRLLDAAKILKFNLVGPRYVISATDILQWQQQFGEGMLPNLMASKIIMGALVSAKYPQGLDREVGKVWAAWQEVLNNDDSEITEYEMPKSQIDFVARMARDESLKIPWSLCQWREALLTYAEQLLESNKKEED